MGRPYRGKVGTNPPADFREHAEAIAKKFHEATMYGDPAELRGDVSPETPLVEVLYDEHNGAEVTIWVDLAEDEVRRIFAEMPGDESLRTTLAELRALHSPRERNELR